MSVGIEHALPGASSVDPDVYAHELRCIWSQSWLLPGCSAEACEPGDFFRFDLAEYAVVPVRDEHGELHALHNTCRHRGMPVCPAQSGTVKRWVCPYHQWSYGLDGRLLGCGGMETVIDRDDYGLHRAPVREVEGLVFVWLDGASEPAPCYDAAHDLAGALHPQGLARAKVAAQIDYDVAANWKLVWQNNRECWHCHDGHPEYVRANFDAVPDTARYRALALERAREHTQVLGDSSAVEEHARLGCMASPPRDGGGRPTERRWRRDS